MLRIIEKILFLFRTFVLIQKYQKIKAKRMPPALPLLFAGPARVLRGRDSSFRLGGLTFSKTKSCNGLASTFDCFFSIFIFYRTPIKNNILYLPIKNISN